MTNGVLAFVALAINPIGGLAVAIPFAVFKLHQPAWLAWLVGLPFAYVQVLVVDFFWERLIRWTWWRGFIERRRSPRVERLVHAKGSFWLTAVFSPFIGPWLVMAFMRYAQVPQRRVALPLLIGLMWTGGIVAIGCSVPGWFHRHNEPVTVAGMATSSH